MTLRPVPVLLTLVALLALGCGGGCGDESAGETDSTDQWLVTATVTPVSVAADGTEVATLLVQVTDPDGQPAPSSTRMLIIGRHDASGMPTGTFGLTGEPQMFLNVEDGGQVRAEFRCNQVGQVTLVARLFSDEVGEAPLECRAP